MLKKFLFTFICVVLLCDVAFAVAGYPNKARLSNTTLTTANTRYEVVIPPGSGSVQIQARQAVDTFIYPTTDSAIYFTLKSGTILNISPLAVDQTLYIQSGVDGSIIELMYWQ